MIIKLRNFGFIFLSLNFTFNITNEQFFFGCVRYDELKAFHYPRYPRTLLDSTKQLLLHSLTR